MKYLPALALIGALLISYVADSKPANASVPAPVRPASKKINASLLPGPGFNKPATPVAIVKLTKTIYGLRNYQISKSLKLKIITPGPFAKHKVARGNYPECYSARFSMKLCYSI